MKRLLRLLGFHVHLWTPWSEPLTDHHLGIPRDDWIDESFQRRTCTDPNCNYIDQRTIGDSVDADLGPPTSTV